MQPELDSPLNKVIQRMVESRFTGLLRVRAQEADGELWFLAGIREDARFGLSKGDEALARMQKATIHSFDVEPRLPGLGGDFKKRLALSGSFAEVRPVTLMQHCETHALTCTLELQGNGRTARIVYQTGELISVEVDSGGNDALAAMLELREGTYRFELPVFELPPGVPKTPTVPPGSDRLSLAERVDMRLREEGGDAAQRKPDTDALAARRKAAEEALEAQRRAKAEAEAQRKAEAARQQREAEQRAAEAKQRAEEEAKRRAEAEAKQRAEAEARRRAEAEAKQRAEEEAKRRAEEEAKRAEEEAKRRAEEEAQRAEEEAKRRAEEEAKRAEEEAQRAEEEAQRQAEVEAKKRAEAEVERAVEKRKAEKAVTAGEKIERAAASEPQKARSTSWVWLVLALVILILAILFWLGRFDALLQR